MILPASFYTQEDVVVLARDLLGKVICTRFDGVLTKGMITETEAYAGTTDRASHAFGGRRTRRTETMYKTGGIAYVYLCYGIHHLFNVVTHQEGVPHAVLLRGVKPLSGMPQMQERRKGKRIGKGFSDGPGTAAQALGIQTKHNGLSLQGPEVWIEDINTTVSDTDVIIGPRIGVDYAGEDAKLPYRFLWKPNE